MADIQLSVREIGPNDVQNIVDYWTKNEPAHLIAMSVDLKKVPAAESLSSMLSEQAGLAYPQKQSYCTIWEINGKPVGHCNVNKIKFGEEAHMHLHFWQKEQ